jgi:hypothetical protein
MRKTKTIAIEREGRDKGKTFLITEMPAMQAEKWAARALLALGRAGVEVPEDAVAAGVAGIMSASFASLAKMPFADAEPLLDEMMLCVQLVPDPTKTDAMTQRPIARALIGEDIEEVPTLLKLRAEVAELHLGFSVTGALSSLAASWMNSRRSASPTSRKRSDRSSPPAKPRSPNSRRSTASKTSTT